LQGISQDQQATV
jgi:hypothetical protein